MKPTWTLECMRHRQLASQVPVKEQRSRWYASLPAMPVTPAGTARRSEPGQRRDASRNERIGFTHLSRRLESRRWMTTMNTSLMDGLSRSRFLSTNATACESKNSTSAPLEFDIGIVGGGIVGALLACLLSSTKLTSALKIAVIEPTPPKPAPPASNTDHNRLPDLRVVSLTPATIDALKQIGLWDSLLQRSLVTRFSEMQIWHTASRGRVKWTSQEYGPDSLGDCLENDVLIKELFDKLREIEASGNHNLRIITERIGKIEKLDLSKRKEQIQSSRNHNLQPSLSSDSFPVLHLKNGERVRVRLVVGSDGSDSIVKKDASISSVGWDYPQRAVVASVRCEHAHNTAWQRFLPKGPIALLPLHDNYSNIVWSTSPEHAKYLCSLDDHQFLSDLNAAFRADSSQFQPGGRQSMFDCQIQDPFSSNLSASFTSSIPYSMLIPILFPTPNESTPPLAIEQIGKRGSFPLRMIHSESYIGSRCALIGDAAHVVHPMAGQGVNLGISDAIDLVSALENALRTGTDIGSMSVLESWDLQRRIENSVTMAGIDILHSVFAVSSGPFTWLRSVGLDLFNSISPIKKLAVERAMGISKLM